VVDGRARIANLVSDRSALHVGMGVVRIDCNCFVDMGDALEQIAREPGEALAGGPEDAGVEAISTQTTLDEIEHLRAFLRQIDDPPLGESLNVGAGRECVAGRKRRIEGDRPEAPLQHRLDRFAREDVGEREASKIVLVGAKVLRTPVARAVYFGLLDRGLQDTDD
jgi:hypothetical protein